MVLTLNLKNLFIYIHLHNIRPKLEGTLSSMRLMGQLFWTNLNEPNYFGYIGYSFKPHS